THAARPHRPLASPARSPRSSKLAMADPGSVVVATTPPVRYETSRSFVARFLGLRHRVAAPPASTPQPFPDVH
ncbi:MAG TPA: hypothetical protein VN224_16320, partial [Xanthomonadales bacterium]|nr:hypothetical protein [Xanthomonadales bacterium]